MPGLGLAALALAFGLVIYAALAGGYGALKGRPRLLESARRAILASFGATVVASLVLLTALGTRDLGFETVARSTSRELPLGYALSAFWATQEGSLLLWLLVLTGVSSVAVTRNASLVRDVLPWTIPILGVVASFFALVLLFVSSPFETVVAPPDGSGLNPSLQNPYMLAHPPFLYLGYVGLTVPFAFAMAALLSRRFDERWIVATRRWTLGAWMFLGISILVGSKWAYEEIGWGGWYAWDPVENAALMPWLVATAFLHSVMVQEKKGMLRAWNAILVALAFALSLFGTFLTRSGVLNSIHSFTQSPIGAWFLGFIVVVVVFSTVLILRRLPDLRSRTRLESLVSREAAFLYNNLFLVAFALTVLWGVAYPLVSEAVRGVASTVGPPYFDFFAVAFGLPLVLLMGIGPLVAWRKASVRSLARSVIWPATAALAVGLALLVAGAGDNAAGLIGYSFATFVIVAIALEFIRGTRARKALGDGGWTTAFVTLVSRNRRRYGGYVVHASIVLLLVGAIGVGAFSTARQGRLAPGETLDVGAYEITYLTSSQARGANAFELRAELAVSRGGAAPTTIRAGKNRYLAEEQTSTEVGIRTDWLRSEDLLLNVDRFYNDGSIFLEATVNPLVNLIWLSAIVFLAGSLIALWPDAREQRRLVTRFATEPSLARPATSSPGQRTTVLATDDRVGG